ncbi:uncharacterized protein LOC129607022 [Condylostylus longicornis]|uniref:uncharacterized protein LOC129607022 n=1 Tax=Condylostylus longicornis TaxID=2530218 RepID=UPI00244DDDBE|nr:uncharacterized protein LOC129607022 [Condylostylus longicornis]
MESSSHLDDLDFQNVAKLNLNKVSSGISKMGYSDGITEGREVMFQKGFDFGYKDGLKTALEISKYEAAAKMLIGKSNNDELVREIQKYRQEKFDERYKAKYFKCNNSKDLQYDIVSSQHNSLLDKEKEILRAKFPNFSNLLG